MTLQALSIIWQPSVNSNWSYSPETLNSVKNVYFSARVTWKFDEWPPENNMALPLCHCKLCRSFRTTCELKLRAKVRKHPNWGKLCFHIRDISLWHRILAFSMAVMFTKGNNSRKIHDDTMTLWKRVRQTDRRTVKRTDRIVLSYDGRNQSEWQGNNRDVRKYRKI